MPQEASTREAAIVCFRECYVPGYRVEDYTWTEVLMSVAGRRRAVVVLALK